VSIIVSIAAGWCLVFGQSLALITRRSLVQSQVAPYFYGTSDISKQTEELVLDGKENSFLPIILHDLL